MDCARFHGHLFTLNSTTRQIRGALGVAIMGTILNSTYLTNINSVQWPARLPAQALEAIHSGVQGAHIVAKRVSFPFGGLGENRI